MREIAKLLNEMRDAGLISNYGLFGAIAQMRYTAPVATIDVDVLVAVPDPDRLDVLAPVYQYCLDRGFQAEGEAIRVGAWPVQFIPAFSPLTVEAMQDAEVADFDGVPLRVVRADYLAAIALSVGRGKDYARVLSLLESGHATRDAIALIARRFGLAASWAAFEKRFLHD
jgi:hypothetical protein